MISRECENQSNGETVLASDLEQHQEVYIWAYIMTEGNLIRLDLSLKTPIFNELYTPPSSCFKVLTF